MSIVFDILRTVKGYQALPFVPARLISPRSGMNTEAFDKADELTRETQSVTGSALRKYKNGVTYFMPVAFSHEGKTWELNEAVLSITGKKTIVETALTGRRGKVKELISIDDYEIKLVAVLENENSDYPEQEMQDLVTLWEINEAINISCALSDYFLKEDDRVVIKSIEPITVEGNEDIQAFSMTLVSDSPFELEIT